MMEFTDRYKELGIPYPNPETMCLGQCEGTGYFPTQRDGECDDLWDAAHAAEPHNCDGYHFVKCPNCGGTGRRR